jgi:hypothetical protein
MIEQAIVFMVAVSLPLMLVVEQITYWRSERGEKRRTTRPRRSRRESRLLRMRGAVQQGRSSRIAGSTLT